MYSFLRNFLNQYVPVYLYVNILQSFIFITKSKSTVTFWFNNIHTSLEISPTIHRLHCSYVLHTQARKWTSTSAKDITAFMSKARRKCTSRRQKKQKPFSRWDKQAELLPKQVWNDNKKVKLIARYSFVLYLLPFFKKNHIPEMNAVSSRSHSDLC